MYLEMEGYESGKVGGRAKPRINLAIIGNMMEL